MTEIIGYISPLNLYGKNMKGKVFKKLDDFKYHCDGYPMPAEIVERWNPVYNGDLEEELLKDKENE